MNIVTKKYKPYPRLRGFLEANNITYDQYARKLGKSRSYVTQRLSGALEWDMEDVRKSMELMQEPLTDIELYFPKGGIHG